MSTTQRVERTLLLEGEIQAQILPPSPISDNFLSNELGLYDLGGDVHIWAAQGELSNVYDLILFMIPKNTPNGDHEIVGEGGRGIRAIFVTSEGAGFASEGTIDSLDWSDSHIDASFDFDVEIESESYKVMGEVHVQIKDSGQQAVEVDSAVTATLSPALIPKVELFSASGFEFRSKGEDSYQLHAWQKIADEEQGIILLVPIHSSGSITAFFTRDFRAYLTKNITWKVLEWDKIERTFKAEFSFEFAGDNKTHKVQQGKIDLKY
ncbi:MAG: hypothetical protein RR736_15040 [Pseudomonas sp.]|uniref:hypothetical protein n=1 Tax=Pseudomonas sp. TaxID=306 RepID=UPI002FCB6806